MQLLLLSCLLTVHLAHANKENIMSTLPELHTSIDAVITTMPNTFNTHQFILAFAQANQQLYIQALNNYVDSSRPFASLHGQIGKTLKQEFSERLTHVDDQESSDIFGHNSVCAVWEKI